MGEDDYVMIREQDLIGCFPSSGARANDIPKLTPCGDRVLLAVDQVASETKGGILLTEGAKEKPVTGTVVAVGPGKAGEDGETKPMQLKAGDKVIYFKYAGDQMSDEEGNAFVVLHEGDVLAKLCFHSPTGLFPFRRASVRPSRDAIATTAIHRSHRSISARRTEY